MTEDDIPEERHDAGFDVVKARRAAKNPNRPGERCRASAGRFVPVVDRRRCEGKAECVAVCPHGVFEVGRIDETEYRAMPALVRFKLWAHGKKTAFTPKANACRACGLCVVACPEKAITLREAPTRG
ncbi:MAG: 4Fe-4S binding protein [Myxococcaceae bacterium]|nr:4Fe-4S binding protein [Myxococcaceae bacterium]